MARGLVYRLTRSDTVGRTSFQAHKSRVPSARQALGLASATPRQRLAVIFMPRPRLERPLRTSIDRTGHVCSKNCSARSPGRGHGQEYRSQSRPDWKTASLRPSPSVTPSTWTSWTPRGILRRDARSDQEHNLVWCGMVWYVWCGFVWHGMATGTVRYNTVQHSL